MRKRILLSITFFLVSLIVCQAQSKESLGDKAMASGNYEQAVTYFMDAVNQNPTEAMKNKLNLATMLRNEFRAIDQAIASQDADELETHIANVLMIDPDNKFVENKRSQFASHSSHLKKEKTKDFLGDALDFMEETFMGSDERQENFHYFSLDEGASYVTTTGDFSGLKLAQHAQLRFYRYFPITIDFNTQLGLKPIFEMWSVGGGSCFFIGDHISIDYGLGYHRNMTEYKSNFTDDDIFWANYYGYTLEEYEKRKDGGLYYRAGLTLMGNKGLGVSYSFNHYTNKTEHPFNAHVISMIACPQNIFSSDWEISDYIGGIAFLSIHAVTLMGILLEMK